MGGRAASERHGSEREQGDWRDTCVTECWYGFLRPLASLAHLTEARAGRDNGAMEADCTHCGAFLPRTCVRGVGDDRCGVVHMMCT